MNQELSDKELNQLYHYKNGIVRLFKTYYAKAGGTDEHLITEKIIFSDGGSLLDRYEQLVCIHSENRLIRFSGNFLYPEETRSNQFLFDKIRSLEYMPYDVLTINIFSQSYHRITCRGEYMIQALAYDMTAEAIWFLFDVREPSKIRCLGLPKEALPDCVGYINEDEILEMDPFEIHDWHRIPDVIADYFQADTHEEKYMFDILTDSSLNIT